MTRAQAVVAAMAASLPHPQRAEVEGHVVQDHDQVGGRRAHGLVEQTLHRASRCDS